MLSLQKALKRIPQEYKGFSFFGNYDVWHYIDTGDPDNECIHCQQYHNFDFTGAQLRSTFPDLTIETDSLIYPNVHQTLWDRDTCKCLLIRVALEDKNPEDIVFYTGNVKVEPYKPQGDTEE